LKPVILGISGPILRTEERDLLRANAPRGVILFSRNIENPSQLYDLISDLRSALSPGAVLMVDQEGGRVARLRPPHWPALPAAATLTTPDAAYAHGRALGAMVRAAGFDITTAPVLDLRYEGASDVIGDRALSANPQTVAVLGAALAQGIMDEGITPVMKHLPGHGRALVDSHLELPVVTGDITADILPFSYNNQLPWAMTAHVLYPELDPESPATISRTIIHDIIRTRIGFAGTLISDDLAMQALRGTPAERALAALAAGCDIALYCPGDMDGNRAILEAVADAG